MSNFQLGKLRYGFTETTTSAGTLNLTASSLMYQILTGTSNHTVVLPDATTLGPSGGLVFIIENNSTGIITVQNNGAVTQATVPAGATNEFIVTDVSSANGVWRTYSSGSSTLSGMGAIGPGAAKNSNYTIVSGDNAGMILVDTTAGAIDVTLPSPSANFKVTIKDSAGTSPVNSIRILRSSNSITIDGEVNDDVISNSFGAITYISDGTNWFRGSVNNATNAGIGLSAGGFTGGVITAIDYVNIGILSNFSSFGDLTQGRYGTGGVCSTTRAVWGGGSNTGGSTPVNTIDYTSFTTRGTASSFGTLTTSRFYAAPANSATRGIFCGGFAGGANAVLDYVTIASTSNATSFGSLVNGGQYAIGGCSSPTRGILFGTNNATGNRIDYVTIATTGNSVNFGITNSPDRGYPITVSSSTRAVCAGGGYSTIEYVTIATTSNGFNFGNLPRVMSIGPGLSNSIRGVIGGNSNNVSCEYLTIAALGNSSTFGNLTQLADTYHSGCANAHGGL